jgi:hypothetical protein
VFDITTSSLAIIPDSPSIAAQTWTWEDDLLDKLDAPSQVASTLTSLPTTLAVIDVVSNYRASISVNQGQYASATGRQPVDARQHCWAICVSTSHVN